MALKQEFKMNLLNAEEMGGLNGGEQPDCQKVGDTIICYILYSVIICVIKQLKFQVEQSIQLC